jgi:hypothetical protein
MANELLNHSIKVTRTKGPPTPYVWEIYRGAEPKWMRRSMHGYATREKAAEAGYRALLRILDQKSSERRQENALPRIKARSQSSQISPK